MTEKITTTIKYTGSSSNGAIILGEFFSCGTSKLLMVTEQEFLMLRHMSENGWLTIVYDTYASWLNEHGFPPEDPGKDPEQKPSGNDTPVDWLLKESETKDIPMLFLYGNIFPATKDNDVLLDFVYQSKLDFFQGALTLKWQGNSTLVFPKKNFTIKLYTDSTKSTKLYKDFRGWGKQYKFCLKANYVDHSHARNLVSAKLWSEVVAARKSIPPLLKASPNNGAVDGFPIKLYVNDRYYGIYTLNIAKDGWLFNMHEDIPTHILLADENHFGAGAFLENAVIDGTDWSLEFPDKLNPSILESFNNMINHVKDTDDATFVANFSQYLDLEACIDYYCFAFLACHLDGLGKNLLMATYDGHTWIPSMYDMDLTWGLHIDGASLVPYCYLFPNEYNCSNSRLWERLKANFAPQIYERYIELRKNVLSVSNIVRHFEKFTATIPPELYDKDLELWPKIPNVDSDFIKQIEEFAIDRAYYTDVIINSYVHKNLFNPKMIDANFFIDTTTGEEKPDGGYYVSRYIPVTEGNSYTMSGGGWSRIAYYDKDLKFLQGMEGNSPITLFAPADTRLARIVLSKSNLDTTMFELGDTATEFVPYGK
jgi:hypothetical protein